MKQLKTPLFTTIVMLTVTMAAQTPMASAETVKETYIKGINIGGVDVIMTLYGDNTSIRNSDGSMVSGLENMRKQYTIFLENGKYTITLKNKDLKALGENHLLEGGDYVLIQKDGEKSVTNGEFVNMLKKFDDRWKIHKSYRYPVAH